MPRSALVTVREFCFSTPRIIMQKWAASITTPDAGRLEHVHDRVGDLVGEPLLHLEPAGEDVHDAGHLGEAEDLAVGDVGDVGPAEERQQVVLAQRVELDVAHHDHALVASPRTPRRPTTSSTDWR